MDPDKLGLPELRVLRRMLAQPYAPHHGYALAKGATRQTHIYRCLYRLEEDGWVTSEWALTQSRGPARRQYRFTPAGRRAALKILARVSAELKPPS